MPDEDVTLVMTPEQQEDKGLQGRAAMGEGNVAMNQEGLELDGALKENLRGAFLWPKSLMAPSCHGV